ncbi:serine hydrolase [Fulvivirga sedimenti]|uniref:Serine hydrolase n=1 Tax=Fulvivirga sedimenti TaxID=2879465 RepID=A0A9X1L3B0_9BACT|nr:serine hydrolase [Fulvivirga sedimenti]MCA6079111.1 serine hydrolase [Fulvivirga sedimenti]
MRLIATVFALLIICASSAPAQKLDKEADALITTMYPAGEPGATILIAKGDNILYQKGFGMANLELDVPMRPEMVMEIGSITKQFTAVSILMLMEEGKLSLDDDITKFIEDYPTHGHHISIHHLLTHTSGIKSYTSMEAWQPEWRTDFTPLELIDFFKNQPMDFAPGEQWSYNNSAYFILGYIIEKASGITYEEFVEKRIFEPLGMTSSYYGSMSKIIENRAYGYQTNEEGYINAEYLSLTQPYAAGSLMSTVGDLYKWNRAVNAGKLVKKETLQLAFTNYKLNNGDPINYGYGWSFSDINGSPTIEHSGGIFGYISNGIYLPDEDVYVAILTNCNCKDPGSLSTKLAAIAIGKPYPDMDDVVKVKPADLEKYLGVYEFEDGALREFTLEEGQLYSQRENSNKFKVFPFEKNKFFYEGTFSQIEFSEDGNSATFINRDTRVSGKKTDKELPRNEEVPVSEEILKQYAGTYNLAPNFDIVMTVEDGKLMTQATGQGKFQLFPKSETRFFLKVVPAEVEFIEGPDGTFDSMILYQNGQEVKGTRKN